VGLGGTVIPKLPLFPPMPKKQILILAAAKRIVKGKGEKEKKGELRASASLGEIFY
jgi:hypothetical protein